MNWRTIVAVIVAFVVGGAAGGLVEHERVKSDHKSGTSSTTTTVARTTAGEAWFGTKSASACPALGRWSTAAAQAYAATAQTSKPWAQTSAALQLQSKAAAAAFRSMIPIANARGKTELTFLIANENQLTAAVLRDKSLAAYVKDQRTLSTARVKQDGVILLSIAKHCPKK